MTCLAAHLFAQKVVAAVPRVVVKTSQRAVIVTSRVVAATAMRAASRAGVLATKPLQLLCHSRSRAGHDSPDLGACVLWGEKEPATEEWSSRTWYLCTSKPETNDARCEMVDEEVPGFEGLTMWACSIPHYALVADDGGEYYSEMMA